ncbi:MAG TPA: SPOR domain-containing protein [Spongiibacteraceae bacterium]|nr:SPOR domain-containing protein [Spongiibacteraceae bacterium]
MAAEDFKGDSLRQRLVGGIALLVIGVIAWFWLLSADSPVDPVSRATQIPPAPDTQPFTVPEPAAPENVASIGSDRDSQPALRADVAADNPVPATSPVPSRPVATQSQSNVEKTRAAPTKSQPASAKTQSAKTKNETFELDQHGLPVAWVVQVGLFSTQATADKVKAALQEKGFKAYTESYRTANVPAGVKVFVGPKLSRERADEQKRGIDAALSVNSKVVRFEPPQR